ncbi:L-2-amino-thiazoline-4-carboxylic acid hydrolase [Faecalimonas sp.]
MKQNLSTQLMGKFLFQIGKEKLTRPCRLEILLEYKRILSNAKDIGKKNTLLSAYVLAAWFIAMNRVDKLSPEENIAILIEGLRNSRIFCIIMGDAEHYLAPKRIEKQKKWAESTKERHYENDWVVELLPGNDEYDLGYDYLECGICKLCHDESCPQFAKYLCRLDYMFAEVMGMRLERTSTLAAGGDKCDFRFSRKK